LEYHFLQFYSVKGTTLLNDIFSKKIFNYPKPLPLINEILRALTSQDDIILDSFAGSASTAHATIDLNLEDGGNRKYILVEMEDYAESLTAERVRMVINGYSEQEGTGGNFDFYELGQPLFLEGGNLNELVGIEKIRKYLYYTETKTALKQSEYKDSKYFLNKHNDTAYYFIYEQDGETTLDKEFLGTIKTTAEQFVIYADNCLLTKEYRTKHHIIFKKIPRDITRF
jgi:adenine-specific DNA-methyltransferase